MLDSSNISILSGQVACFLEQIAVFFDTHQNAY